MHSHDLENIMYKWSSCNKGEILIIIHIFSSNQLQIRMLKVAGRHIAIFANFSAKMLIPTPWITLILITEMKEKMRTLLIMRNSVPIAFPRKIVRRRNEVSQSLINLNAKFYLILNLHSNRFSLLVRIM